MSLPIRGARLLSRLNYGKPTVGFDLFNRHVVEDGTDDPITGFQQANQLTLEAVASLVPETGTGEITITVEGYDPDLDSWDPVAEFTPLDAAGSETITPEDGWPDQLRVTYAITGDAQWRARVRCRATASFTVSQIGPPGGGSQPTMEVVDSGPVSTAPGGASMPFAHWQGDALLSYTDPDNPTVIEAGTYALSFTVSIDPTDATCLTASLGVGAETLSNSAPVLPANNALALCIGATLNLGAGDAINCAVFHDNTGSRDCAISGYVVKLA